MATTILPFPDKSASPNQIRSFLAQLLVTKHDMSADEAQAVAESWKMGRGSHFLEANYDTFKRVFGEAIGPYLYRTVWDMDDELWRQTTAATVYNGTDRMNHIGLLGLR